MFILVRSAAITCIFQGTKARGAAITCVLQVMMVRGASIPCVFTFVLQVMMARGASIACFFASDEGQGGCHHLRFSSDDSQPPVCSPVFGLLFCFASVAYVVLRFLRLFGSS